MKKKSIIQMNRSSRIRAHRKLWRWLAKNPEMHKHDWPEWAQNGGRYAKEFANCFLCYCGCSNCPVIWPNTDIYCDKSLFGEWIRCTNLEEKAKIAKQIAELSVRRIGK